MTSWLGTWRNQYGSLIVITDDARGRLDGWFRTALPSSPFAGLDAPITGVHAGRTLAFVCGANPVGRPDGVVVSYTGKLDGARMETLWFVVDGSAEWWAAATTNHDTFDHVSERPSSTA